MEQDIIMLFLDLEGTIIDEEKGTIKGESINKLLDSINKLQDTVNLPVKIHIASPVSADKMEEIIDQLDRRIARYNMSNKANINEIESAVAYEDKTFIHQDDLYDKIFPMKMPKEDFGRAGKTNYVNQWINILGNKTRFIIYGGNGLNDVGAMNRVKDTKKGFVICPNNSHKEVKKIADFISNKDEAEGIKEGIDFITNQIQIRLEKTNNDNNKGER